MKECEEWIREGVSLLDGSQGKYSEDYFYHFHIYRLLAENHSDDELVSFIEEEALPYFKGKKHMNSIIKYAYILGDRFKHLHRYKKASHYYELSLLIIKENHLGGMHV